MMKAARDNVAGVLQEGEEDKQMADLGQEGQYAAHAGDDAVHQQSLHPGGGTCGDQDVPEPTGRSSC